MFEFKSLVECKEDYLLKLGCPDAPASVLKTVVL